MRKKPKIIKKNRPNGMLAKATQEKLKTAGSIKEYKNKNKNHKNVLQRFFMPEGTVLDVSSKDRTISYDNLKEVKDYTDGNGNALSQKEKLKDITKVTEGLYIGSKHAPPELWQIKFFEKLQDTGSIKRACEYAEISRNTLEKYRKKDDPECKEFNELIRLCKEDYLEQLEEEADRRGYKGYHEEVIYKGQRTNIYITRYSDYLLALRLKAESPKYREGGVQINTQDNRKTVNISFTDSDGIFQIE